MTTAVVVAALLAGVIPGWTRLARRVWCARQRTLLRGRGVAVVWVHDGAKMPWALWGAENGFFEVDWANRVPYLRAAAAS
jgi:hypothetical protein